MAAEDDGFDFDFDSVKYQNYNNETLKNIFNIY